jgi:hypothetical protein
MATNIRPADIHGTLERYHVWYEVQPYYIELELRPVGKPVVFQKIQAGFDIDLFGTVPDMQMPSPHTPEGYPVAHYFEAVAEEVQSKVGNRCTIEVIQKWDSLIIDTHRNFAPEVRLRIRISHERGLDQAAGPAEEQALNAIRDRLHELDVRQG